MSSCMANYAIVTGAVSELMLLMLMMMIIVMIMTTTVMTVLSLRCALNSR